MEESGTKPHIPFGFKHFALFSLKPSVYERVSLSLYKQYFVCYIYNSCLMNNIISFNISTPDDVAKQIATRVKARRLELNLTQEGIAARAGLKFATYRRFEQTGEISLKGLLQIGFALNALSEFDALFAQKQYQSLDDVLNEQNVIRKRGKKNE
jgi:isopentenyl phosphate kinase